MANRTNTVPSPEIEQSPKIEQTYEEWAKQKVKIKLPRIPNTKNNDVYVSVNDHNFLIKRGVEVEVPRYVAACIEDAERAEEEAEKYNEQMSQN